MSIVPVDAGRSRHQSYQVAGFMVKVVDRKPG
jgi:hypothetical protein